MQLVSVLLNPGEIRDRKQSWKNVAFRFFSISRKQQINVTRRRKTSTAKLSALRVCGALKLIHCDTLKSSRPIIKDDREDERATKKKEDVEG